MTTCELDATGEGGDRVDRRSSQAGSTEARPAEREVLERVIGAIRGPASGAAASSRHPVARDRSTSTPTLVVTCGVHGNEHAGAKAARRVLDLVANSGPAALRGQFVVLRGNLAALSTPPDGEGRRPRYLDEDLNRLFRTEVLEARDAPDDPVEHREARALANAIDEAFHAANGARFLVDLHTVSAPSVPFLAIEDSLPARTFARAFTLPMILGIEEELGGLLMDWATNERDAVAMVIEAGEHDDPRSVAIHEAVILTALDAAGVLVAADLRGRAAEARAMLRRSAGVRAGHAYDVRHRQAIADASFVARAEARSFRRVRARETVVADELGREVHAPTGGLLFMPNRQTDRRPGDDAFFVVQPVHGAWLALSAWLRSRPSVHAALPHVLPGVRRDPEDPNRLLVAPEIAVVLKRQLFHLLGYRLERHGPDEHPRALARVGRALAAVARALGTIVAGVFRGGERAALPEERPDDWIVRRRRLDVGEGAARAR